MSLNQKDVELIERIIYKNADDIAVSIARSFERLEIRIDSLEERLSNKNLVVADEVHDLREEMHSLRVDIKANAPGSNLSKCCGYPIGDDGRCFKCKNEA